MRRQDPSGIRPLKQSAVALAALILGAVWWTAAWSAEPLATLRGAEIDQEPAPPMLSNPSNNDLRRGRSYPEQPPTIPHQIRNYQVDLNTNKCMTCHSRTAIEETQAPMVSVTHFVDREGQVRAFISPRRYFCDQCHVTQHEARPLVGNMFIDVDKLLLDLGDGKGN
jgi:cytochrome c-type protein NapB